MPQWEPKLEEGKHIADFLCCNSLCPQAWMSKEISDLADNTSSARLFSHVKEQIVKVLLAYITAQNAFNPTA